MFRFYEGKRVLITGHTGFKGSWLTMWLKLLGADILGYSLKPETKPSMFNELLLCEICDSEFGNILNDTHLQKIFNRFKPEMVFHLAAQPLVRRSYREPVLTYETNVLGTLKVLEAARNCAEVKAFVNVTTDKCYENKEIIRGYTEEDSIGGYDMYSSSKGCVEILSSSYRRSFLQNEGSMLLATARAGNVIGGGDWAEDRIIPDCIRAINLGIDIKIRNPYAVRPWQHVLESLSGYLLLGQKLYMGGKEFADCFNFGPSEKDVLTVSEIANMVCHFYGKGRVVVEEKKDLHEAGLLMLNTEKAAKILGWCPNWNAQQAVKNTVEWYKRFYDEDDSLYDYTMLQIKQYEDSIKWSNIYATR